MMNTHKVIKCAAVLATGVWLVGSTPRPAHAQDAKQLYEKNCIPCHGPSGKGDGPVGKMLKPPPADLGSVTKGTADGDVAKIIKDGGKSVGKSTAMPGFKGKLTDEQIEGLVKYVKGFASK